MPHKAAVERSCECSYLSPTKGHSYRIDEALSQYNELLSYFWGLTSAKSFEVCKLGAMGTQRDLKLFQGCLGFLRRMFDELFPANVSGGFHV